MKMEHHSPRLRRVFAYAALAALLGLTVVGLTQCRMVGDTVTGVELQQNSVTHSRSSCVRECNEQRKQCIRTALANYKATRRACGSDFSCRKNALIRLLLDLKECIRQSQLCKRGCYNEGSGSSGR